MPISALIDSVLRFWLVVCMSVLMWEGRSFHEFHTIYVLHRQPLVLKAFTCWLHVPWGMPITLSLYRYTWYFLTTQTLCVGFVCVSSHLVLGKVSCAGALVKHMQTISNLICCTSLSLEIPPHPFSLKISCSMMFAYSLWSRLLTDWARRMALIGNFTMSSYTWPGPDAVPLQRFCFLQPFCRSHLSRSQNCPSHSKSDFRSLGIVPDVTSCHPNSIGSCRIHSDSFPC